MHIQFGDITRGEGKVYQEVKCDIPDGSRLIASSLSSDGTELPCVLSSYGRKPGSHVLILAAVSCSQKVTFELLSKTGSVVDSATENIAHIRAALTSKFNTFSKKDGVESIRNIDWSPIDDESFIECYLAVMNYESDTRTLYFRIDAPTDERVKSEFTFLILGKDGHSLEAKDVTILRDSLFSEGQSQKSIRHIELSCCVKHDLDDFIAWIRFADSRTDDGFIRSLPFRTGAIKCMSDSLMLDNSGMGGNYQDWFLRKHRTSAQKIELQRGHKFDIEPLFSIIVPLFKTPIKYFQEMLESVLGQSYSKFELILVNASPEDEALKHEVLSACKRDSRVRYIDLDGNYGITLNTNEGIKIAQGDFLSFFDHDDILEPDILFEYVKGINEYPETDLLYCDEDKLIEDRYIDGLLKPDFDWDLICACNYVCHLLTVRRCIVDSFDSLPGKQYDGSQDHNMTLLVAERARNIYHARKILYHWRIHPGSTASGSDAKPWTQESGRIAVQEHLDRCRIPARVTDHDGMGNFYDVEYLLGDKEELVSIVVPTKDHIDYLDRCLKSIFQKTIYSNYEVIVVENNSERPETFEYYEALKREHPNVSVVKYDAPFNFSAVCNAGAKAANGELLLFLNNDTQVIEPLWLDRIVGQLKREKVGCVGAKLLYPNGAIQHLGIVLPKSGPVHVDELRSAEANGYFGFLKFPRNVSAVTGACLAVRVEVFNSVGGFDEGFPVAYNDVDFCLKIREKNLLVVVEPRAQLYHFESVSRGYDEKNEMQLVRLMQEQGTLMSRYPKYFAIGDPYYNCNLAKGSTHYELGW